MRVLSHFSCVRLFATLWTVAHQAALSMGFSRQGCHTLLQGIFLTQGSNPCLFYLLHWLTTSTTYCSMLTTFVWDIDIIMTNVMQLLG